MTAMHIAVCPTCGTRVEVDFEPVAGVVWCPTCQETFSRLDTAKQETPDSTWSDGRNGDEDI
jgi:hypothetical protein